MIVVALDEDPTIRIVGNLVEDAAGPINAIDPATIRIGEPVRVVFAPIEDVALPRWVRTWERHQARPWGEGPGLVTGRRSGGARRRDLGRVRRPDAPPCRPVTGSRRRLARVRSQWSWLAIHARARSRSRLLFAMSHSLLSPRTASPRSSVLT